MLHSIVPADTQQTDTYFVVAHFHYVLFGGLVFGVFGGIYYWFPKIYGRYLNETLGKINFWTLVLGFNLTFFPMHFLGLWGLPRRTYRYDSGMGWDTLNYVATIGAFIIAVSTLVFLANVLVSRYRGEPAPGDAWDGRSLEWSIPSPPPEYNFAEIPVVHARDDFWHRKYTEDDEGRLVRLPAGGAVAVEERTTGGDGDGDGHGEHIHMPSPSFYPLVLASGLPFLGYAAVWQDLRWVVPGLLLVLFGMYAWAMEPPAAEEG